MIEQLKQHGMTPGKAALMAALAVGLGVVWGPQIVGAFGSSAKRPSKAPRLSAEAAGTSDAKKPEAPSGQATNAKPTKPKRPAPTIGLSEAVRYDPFSVPAWAPAARRLAQSRRDATDDPTELEERFEAIRQSGVAMILVSRQGRAAQVGERTLRVGDEVDGFEVVEINDSGVVFQPTATPGDDRGA